MLIWTSASWAGVIFPSFFDSRFQLRVERGVGRDGTCWQPARPINAPAARTFPTREVRPIHVMARNPSWVIPSGRRRDPEEWSVRSKQEAGPEWRRVEALEDSPGQALHPLELLSLDGSAGGPPASWLGSVGVRSVRIWKTVGRWRLPTGAIVSRP